MDTTTIALLSLLVAFIGLLITIIEKWSVIAPQLSSAIKKISTKFKKPPRSRSRRKFIGWSAGAISLGVIATISYKWLSSTTKPIKGIWTKFGAINEFVVNEKNGVIHLKGICDDHLPNRKVTINHTHASRIHRGSKVNITGAIVNRLPDELREELLLDAIKSSPTSTHLYNYIIKQWGRTKEYSKIHNLLSANLKYLNTLLKTEQNIRRKKLYSKAIEDLRNRKVRADYLAEISRI